MALQFLGFLAAIGFILLALIKAVELLQTLSTTPRKTTKKGK